MTEHRPPWPADKEPKERGLYQGYERFASESSVRAAFLAKYGYPAKSATLDGGGWKLGPIREEG